MQLADMLITLGEYYQSEKKHIKQHKFAFPLHFVQKRVSIYDK